jgi:hypothetical protein
MEAGRGDDEDDDGLAATGVEDLGSTFTKVTVGEEEEGDDDAAADAAGAGGTMAPVWKAGTGGITGKAEERAGRPTLPPPAADADAA